LSLSPFLFLYFFFSFLSFLYSLLLSKKEFSSRQGSFKKKKRKEKKKMNPLLAAGFISGLAITIFVLVQIWRSCRVFRQEQQRDESRVSYFSLFLRNSSLQKLTLHILLLCSIVLCFPAFAPLEYEQTNPWLRSSTLLLALAFLVLFYSHISIHRSSVDQSLPLFVFPVLFLAWFLLLLSFVLEHILLSVFRLSRFYLMTDVTLSVWFLCVFCCNLRVYGCLSSLHYEPLSDDRPKQNLFLVHSSPHSPLYGFHLSIFFWSLGLLILFFYDLCFQLYHFNTPLTQPSLLQLSLPFLHLILLLLFSVVGSSSLRATFPPPPPSDLPISPDSIPEILITPLEQLPLTTNEEEVAPPNTEHSISVELSPPNTNEL
jgi:hypothetical protein